MQGKNQIGAAIICIHCASREFPIMYAERSASNDDPVDSGWQFTCNKKPHKNVSDAKIWALDEVLELEPTLREFVKLPYGTILSRSSANAKWEVFNT